MLDFVKYFFFMNWYKYVINAECIGFLDFELTLSNSHWKY